jgi:hypothetical protein
MWYRAHTDKKRSRGKEKGQWNQWGDGLREGRGREREGDSLTIYIHTPTFLPPPHPHHTTHIAALPCPVVDRRERERVIDRMVSEGIEVWVVWCGVKKVFYKQKSYTKVSGEKMKAMEARHVGIQREREIEGGKRGKGDA